MGSTVGIPALKGGRDVNAHDCNIVSIEAFRKNSSQHIQWTNVMTTAPQASAEIAFFFLPRELKYLVLCRNYGEITSITFDDAEVNDTTVMRVPTKHFSTFLQPYSKTLILPNSQAQYDAFEAFLASMNLPVMGPLTSARAVYNMQNYGCSPAAALQMAADQKTALVNEQTECIRIAQKIMQTN